MTTARGPLAGLRVLDAATLYAGPFISTLLADHGADVIKIEPPGGDPYRERPLWAILARDKRSVTIDLRSTAGCALLRALAAHVDVLVLNMLPHQLEARGLTWADLSDVNPDLILVCLTSFGLDGPYAERPGSGTLGEALAGLTHLTGYPDGKPTLASVPLGDAVTGWVGAFGVLAACYERANGGGGQVIDVNPADALLHLAAPALAEWEPGSPAPTRQGGRLSGSPVRNTYQCADGSWVAISCSTPRHLQQLGELVGAENDPTAIDGAVAAWTAGMSRDDIIAAMAERRLPAVPVHDAAGVCADPHFVARGAVRTAKTTEVGERFVVAPAPRFGRHDFASAVECVEVGTDTAQVLTELLGLSGDDLTRLAAEGVI